MSRTIRRKNRWFDWHLITTARVEERDLKWAGVKTKAEYLAKPIRRMHSDMGTQSHLSYWWCIKLIEPRFTRRESNRELLRCIRNDNWDDFLVPVFRSGRLWF